MAKLKTGKEEIVYLLTQVVRKFQKETGRELVLNTNRKNYQELAVSLSEISNQLPLKYAQWDTDRYTGRERDEQLQYPYRKYDITGGQIKDALNGVVSNPRPFLVDACYIYLYGIGRNGFEKNPSDPGLLRPEADRAALPEPGSPAGSPEARKVKKRGSAIQTIAWVAAFMMALTALLSFIWGKNAREQLQDLKKDMSLLPYTPTPQEIDSLEGIWLCYTGSPQARSSYKDRYHKVVSNLLEVTYKEGYFVFKRYGASFDHLGYMQYESPGLVSIYSRIANKTGKVESPRHSLMNLRGGRQYIPVISASWNFDTGDKNRMVGIREVYQKLGKGGHLQETINQIENASCQCKIVKWVKEGSQTRTYHLKNHDLDSVVPAGIRPLIDAHSILLNQPDSGLIQIQDPAPAGGLH